MPIREYQCSKCGHVFEDFQTSQKAPKRIECPHCETKTAEILPSLVGGYHILGNNSSSVRPRKAGSFRGRK